MIYRLQRKFIFICTASVLAVIFLVFVLITSFSIYSMNKNLDLLADGVSAGGGRFPEHFQELPPKKHSQKEQNFNFITTETPFSTRHFTVWFDNSGELLRVNTDFIHSVTQEEAVSLASETIARSRKRGWSANYRYKIFSDENGKAIVFIDGSMNRSQALQSITISAAVLLGCAALVISLVVLLSKKVVKPIAESYEKQRRFVTDANHELKTPLTLILANLDIAEAELGQNEWLDDIRSEGQRMAELVEQLVALSRMDEENTQMNISLLPFGEIVADTTSDFKALAESRNKTLYSEIDTSVILNGDEILLRRLLSVLLDNALKYCDDGGEIFVKLEKRGKIILTVENTYKNVSDIELDHLFDRFYRADSSRKYIGGFGIGLSIAKAIVDKHKGEISAHKKGEASIYFKVVL